MSDVHDALTQRTLALAAMLQAVRMVDRIARKGSSDRDDFATLLQSILTTQATHAEALYGSPAELRVGLRLIHDLLSGRETGRAKELMRYTVALMSLEKKLAAEADMLARLADGIQRIRKQADYFNSVTHESVIAAIANLYGETLSTLKPRIIVHGKQEFLRQSEHTNRIRCLLLAGIRAAHLWREHGGNHLTLLLRRKAILRTCDRLLRESSPSA